MRRILLVIAILLALSPLTSLADTGIPVEKCTYFSPNHMYSLAVDPRWQSDPWRPVLTLTRTTSWFGLFARKQEIWRRSPSQFEDFHFPLDVKLSDDGAYLVFGGASAHNTIFDTGYREGLRFYRSDGHLIRFISRRDLPVGSYGVSTSDWYDSERSYVEGHTLTFYSPTRPVPILFDLETGAVLKGRVVSGQGDDHHHQDWLRRRSGNRLLTGRHSRSTSQPIQLRRFLKELTPQRRFHNRKCQH